MRKIYFALTAMVAMALTVTCYGASTGIRQSTSTDVNRMGYSASPTDDIGKGGTLKNGLSYESPDPVVYIEHGQVVLKAVVEDHEFHGKALSSDLRSSNDYGLYIDIANSPIGTRIWVPSDYQEGAFYVDNNGLLHGMRNSTFTCYTDTYSVHFPCYGIPQYRYTNGTGYQWQDINLTYVSSPNVNVEGAHVNFWSDKFITLLMTAIGGLCVCLYLKR